jgi:hypothetical protein
VDAVRDDGGQECPELGHPIVDIGHPHGAVFDGAAVALLERRIGVPFRPPLREGRRVSDRLCKGCLLLMEGRH